MAGGTEAFSAFVRFFVKDEVSSEAQRVEQSARSAAQGMDEAADSGGNRLSNGLAKAKSAAGTAAKGLAVIGGAATAAVGGMFALVGATEETRENLGKLDTAFEASGNSVEAGRKAYSDFYGLVGDSDQATEAAQNLARLTTSQEELNQWTNISAGAFAAFGDALPVENLTETATETAKTGQVVGSMADALNWSTASAEQWSSAMSGHAGAQAAWNQAIADGATKEDAFNAALAACSSEQERSQLITEALNGVYGETGQKYLEQNAALIENRKAQAEWNNTMAEAGTAVTPIITAITQIGVQLLTMAMPYLQQFAGWFTANLPMIQAGIQNFIAQFSAAFQAAWPVIQPLLQGLMQVFSWLLANLPMILPIVLPLIAGFMGLQVVTPIITALFNAFNIFKTAIQGVTMVFNLLKVAFMANPFGLIITIITTLVGIFMTLWNTNEGFRNAVMGIWNAISSTAQSVFGAIGSFISGVFNSIASVASSVWNGISGVISGVVNTIKSVISGGFNAAKSVVSGVFNGIKSTISSVMNGAKSVVSGAINFIKGIFNFSWSLPRLKLPHFRISGSFSLNPLSVPSFGIDWYAKGAVFDTATILPTADGGLAGVGEAGAEAVAPISVLQKYVREAVADAMGGNGGGGYVANINVTTGETSEDKLAKLIAREQKRQAYAMGAI